MPSAFLRCFLTVKHPQDFDVMVPVFGIVRIHLSASSVFLESSVQVAHLFECVSQPAVRLNALTIAADRFEHLYPGALPIVEHEERNPEFPVQIAVSRVEQRCSSEELDRLFELAARP